MVSPALYGALFIGVSIVAVVAMLPTVIVVVAWSVSSPSLTVSVTLYVPLWYMSGTGWPVSMLCRRRNPTHRSVLSTDRGRSNLAMKSRRPGVRAHYLAWQSRRR